MEGGAECVFYIIGVVSVGKDYVEWSIKGCCADVVLERFGITLFFVFLE